MLKYFEAGDRVGIQYISVILYIQHFSAFQIEVEGNWGGLFKVVL